jgi:hypothetical protein
MKNATQETKTLLHKVGTAEGSGLVKRKLPADQIYYLQCVIRYILSTFIETDAAQPSSSPSLLFILQNPVDTTKNSDYTSYLLVPKKNKLLIKK